MPARILPIMVPFVWCGMLAALPVAGSLTVLAVAA